MDGLEGMVLKGVAGVGEQNILDLVGEAVVKVPEGRTGLVVQNGWGAGHEVLMGGAGHEVLVGGAGHEVLVGGAGHEVLVGGAGHEVLVGGAGHEVLVGGAGHEVLVGVGLATRSWWVGLDLRWAGSGGQKVLTKVQVHLLSFVCLAM